LSQTKIMYITAYAALNLKCISENERYQMASMP